MTIENLDILEDEYAEEIDPDVSDDTEVDEKQIEEQKKKFKYEMPLDTPNFQDFGNPGGIED